MSWGWAEVLSPGNAGSDGSQNWYVWRIAEDERTCPVCAPLDGRLINGAVGPFPPLHTNCRCRLVFSHSDPGPDPEDVEPPVVPPAIPGIPGPF